jgi:hypothetical protein
MPLVLLGGRDRRSTVLPKAGEGKRLLRGYKAVDLRLGERRLIEVLIERFRATEAFDTVYIAGPRAIYEPLGLDVEIIDTDASFGENLAVCAQTMMEREPGRQVMFTTSDILPDVGELKDAIDDLRSHLPLDFWMPQIRVPVDKEELGQSSWKPKYRFIPEKEDEPVRVLPGHLIAVDPAVAYRDLIYRFFGGLYRTRNLPIRKRYFALTRRVLFTLMRDDVLGLLRFQWRNNTLRVVYNCLVAAKKLIVGNSTQEELEVRMRRIFIRVEHLRRHRELRGRVAVLGALSLAKDIDTEEEAQELARQI